MSTIRSKPGLSTPISVRTDEPETPASTGQAAAQPPEPKREPDWQDKAKKAALTVASQNFALVNVSGQLGGALANLHFHGKLTEKVALLPNDRLVTSNPDRAAAKHLTWTRVAVVADAGASLLGFGYDRGVKVSAIVPTDTKVSGKSLAQLPVDQAKLMTLEFHPQLIGKYPAGTEFHIAEHKTNSAGAVFTADTSVLNVHAGAEIGAEVLWDRSSYAKTVTVKPDNRLRVRIDKMSRLGASVGAGVGIGLGGVDGDRRQNVGDFRQEANHADILHFHVGAGASTKSSIALSGHFDLDSKPGTDAYGYLMEADPHELGTSPKEAKQALKKYGVKVAYAEKTTQSGTDLSASVMGQNLFNVGSSARTTQGTLYEVVDTEQGQTIVQTRMSEKEYTRTATGLMPRWAAGEERETLIRMGSVVHDGKKEDSMLLALKVMDPEVSKAESREAANFARSMGIDHHQAPSGKQSEGELSVQIALTNESIGKLDAMSKDEFAAAMGRALEGIAGHPLPWNDDRVGKQSTAYWNEQFKEPLTIKQRWAEAMNDLAQGSSTNPLQDMNAVPEFNIKRQYESSTGRDYYDDLNTRRSIDMLAEEFEASKGKSLEKRGPFLKTLSRLSARDLRAAILTLRQSTGAGLVGLHYKGRGIEIHSSERAAPQSVGERASAALDRS